MRPAMMAPLMYVFLPARPSICRLANFRVAACTPGLVGPLPTPAKFWSEVTRVDAVRTHLRVELTTAAPSICRQTRLGRGVWVLIVSSCPTTGRGWRPAMMAPLMYVFLPARPASSCTGVVRRRTTRGFSFSGPPLGGPPQPASTYCTPLSQEATGVAT